ncbi:adenylate/guanylate cyclase domain-containing protein [Rhizobium sp. RAF56]|uniref:adenylate/guanylate cyclase domain-containing protein n=1 Tax=Rhizobium sp. RAF56 TaxID=3233062 RepID=UPI003F9BD2E9
MNTSIHATKSNSPRAGGTRGVDINPALSIVEWLSGDECHALDEPGLLAAFGRRLRAIGLPVDRLTLHLMTLHPEFLGRTLAWAPGEPIEIHDREHGAHVTFARSPLRKVMDTRQPMIVSVTDGDQDSWQDIDVFAGRSLSQLMIAPLCNVDGPVSAVVFATKEARGFMPSDIQMLERLLPALRNTCELRIMRQIELSLLDTYVGPMTAQRILAGRIRQGEIESLEAALILCDLRGFTELSNRFPPGEMLELLNAYFDIVVPAITREGGEVLKFMGDAVLAFFPTADAEEASTAALSAARSIVDELADFRDNGLKLRAGIALHYGKVSYGNIGSGHRLDFTVIGSDVNLLSRIQSACGVLGKTILMSDAFRQKVADEDVQSAGFHRLRGFERNIELFGLEATDDGIL